LLESSGNSKSINAGLFPPCNFITRAVNFAMVAPAERDGELVADLASQRAQLREPEMVGVGWLSSAYQAWTHCDVFDVLAIAKSTRLWERNGSTIATASVPAIPEASTRFLLSGDSKRRQADTRVPARHWATAPDSL